MQKELIFCSDRMGLYLPFWAVAQEGLVTLTTAHMQKNLYIYLFLSLSALSEAQIRPSNASASPSKASARPLKNLSQDFRGFSQTFKSLSQASAKPSDGITKRHQGLSSVRHQLGLSQASYIGH